MALVQDATVSCTKDNVGMCLEFVIRNKNMDQEETSLFWEVFPLKILFLKKKKKAHVFINMY